MAAGIVGPKILVVERDESFRRLVSDRLRRDRYKVHEACHELEARGMLCRKDLDVVLIGVTGDSKSALALLGTIKEIRPLVQVILLRPSGGPFPCDEHPGNEAGSV